MDPPALATAAVCCEAVLRGDLLKLLSPRLARVAEEHLDTGGGGVGKAGLHIGSSSPPGQLVARHEVFDLRKPLVEVLDETLRSTRLPPIAGCRAKTSGRWSGRGSWLVRLPAIWFCEMKMFGQVQAETKHP